MAALLGTNIFNAIFTITIVIFATCRCKWSSKSLRNTPDHLVSKVPHSGENHRVRGKYDVLGASRRQIHQHTGCEGNKENEHVGKQGIHFTIFNYDFKNLSR